MNRLSSNALMGDFKSSTYPEPVTEKYPLHIRGRFIIGATAGVWAAIGAATMAATGTTPVEVTKAVSHAAEEVKNAVIEYDRRISAPPVCTPPSITG